MGAVKNHFHDEICAAADDQLADEFDCYEARLHSMLTDLDWLIKTANPPASVTLDAYMLRNGIKRMMK